jgi:hypothetical protein
MSLQLIQDENRKDTGVFVPINEWNEIVKTHGDLKALISGSIKPKRKLSELAGSLSSETAAAMQKYVEESRNEWEERLNDQFK